MGETSAELQLQDMEKIICKVKGVISSKIIMDEKNRISEIHVLADSRRSPKQIVRDIESSLLIKGSIVIDHKKVSVVQTQGDEQPQDSNRPRLVTINSLSSGLSAEVQVQLSVGENLYEGVALGANISSNRLRLVAAATLDALETLLDAKAKFVVEDIVKIRLGRNEAVNVSVSVITAQGEDFLLGSAYIKSDDREAVGKATLNALNRKISLFK